MDFPFDLYDFFGVELGDWIEVVLRLGVMDRPGSGAVGIGAEIHVENYKLFAIDELWRPPLEACRALLRVATIPQVICSSIHIAAPSSQVVALLLLKPGHSIRGWTPLALSDVRKSVLHGFRKRLSDIHIFASQCFLTCIWHIFWKKKLARTRDLFDVTYAKLCGRGNMSTTEYKLVSKLLGENWQNSNKFNEQSCTTMDVSIQ